MLTLENARQVLHGCEYGEEGNREFWKQMKESRLVAIYGASDDTTIINGAEDDVLYGRDIFFNSNGLVEVSKFKVEVLWCKEDDYSWTYKTNIPHVTFDVMDYDDKYCRGIIFSLDSCEEILPDDIDYKSMYKEAKALLNEALSTLKEADNNYHNTGPMQKKISNFLLK